MYQDISVRVQGGNETVLPDEYILVLDITTYIGVLFSLMGLVIMLLTYLVFKWECVHVLVNALVCKFLGKFVKEMLPSFMCS